LIEFAAYRPFDFQRGEGEAGGDTRYIAYVIRPDGEVQSKDLGPAQEADDAVAALRKALGDPRRNDVYELSRAVDRKIIQPIRALLGNARQLLISPDGELNLIPFEALIDEQAHWLVERYSMPGGICSGCKLRAQTGAGRRWLPTPSSEIRTADRSTGRIC
jgi:CHAT domain-containing protein